MKNLILVHLQTEDRARLAWGPVHTIRDKNTINHWYATSFAHQKIFGMGSVLVVYVCFF